MSELPEVRRADCGHGFLPIDTPPSATTQNGIHQQDVYLCDECRSRLPQRRVETKEIRPGVPLERTPEELRATKVVADPYESGRLAAIGGASEDECPYSDRRTRDAKEWLRGFREGRSEDHGEQKGGA